MAVKEFTDNEREKLKSSKKKIAVIGDIMLDKYLYGSVVRISPEAPVPIINITSEKSTLGGAANVAANLSKLGADVYLFGTTGNDDSRVELIKLLHILNINVEGIKLNDKPTITKTRIIGLNQQMLRIDREVNEEIGELVQSELIKSFESLIKQGLDCVVISDYNKGVCVENLVEQIIEKCISNNISVLVDPKGTTWEKYRGATFITPNVKELGDVVNKKIKNTDEEIASIGRLVIEKYAFKNLLVTRSEKGMSILGDEEYHIPTEAKEVFDVSGAGDTVISTLAYFISHRYKKNTCINLANIAAGVAVSHFGTYAVSIDEIIQKIESTKTNSNRKVIGYSELDTIVTLHKENNDTIVFTNGCFDILHIGHINYLREAKKLGDILIVGLNSDDSVRRLKGAKRPINNEFSRCEMLAALEFIDYVVIFEKDTPEELIKFVKPDILVKGGDYKVEDVVGKEYSKKVEILKFVEGYSTTKIVNKIGDMFGK